MVSIEELRKIFLLQNLTDGMLEKIIPICEFCTSVRGTIFEEGNKAENFYMLKNGKVLLEAANFGPLDHRPRVHQVRLLLWMVRPALRALSYPPCGVRGTL